MDSSKHLKIIVAGSRTINNYDTIYTTLDGCFKTTKRKIEIISGEARGVDTIAKRYAEERNYSYTGFPADWNQHGKAAGPIRNREMAIYADGLIAFWDGQSRGTKNMINTIQKLNKPYKIFTLND